MLHLFLFHLKKDGNDLLKNILLVIVLLDLKKENVKLY